MAGISDNSTARGSLWGELLSASVYKRNQGRIARQLTFAALAAVIGSLASRPTAPERLRQAFGA